jgi:hypothetical protein
MEHGGAAVALQRAAETRRQEHDVRVVQMIDAFGTREACFAFNDLEPDEIPARYVEFTGASGTEIPAVEQDFGAMDERRGQQALAPGLTGNASAGSAFIYVPPTIVALHHCECRWRGHYGGVLSDPQAKSAASGWRQRSCRPRGFVCSCVSVGQRCAPIFLSGACRAGVRAP